MVLPLCIPASAVCLFSLSTHRWTAGCGRPRKRTSAVLVHGNWLCRWIGAGTEIWAAATCFACSALHWPSASDRVWRAFSELQRQGPASRRRCAWRNYENLQHLRRALARASEAAKRQVTHFQSHPHLERTWLPGSVGRHSRTHSATAALLARAKAPRRSGSESARAPAEKALTGRGDREIDLSAPSGVAGGPHPLLKLQNGEWPKSG